MNKGIIIGISIAIIIGVAVIAVSSNLDVVNETSIIDVVKPKPKQFTVGLEESVGFSGG